MAHWANRDIADADSFPVHGRPPAGTRLDQILAELKTRPHSRPREPEDETPRNVTPLQTPFRAEIQSLQASIDQLADKMDSQRLIAAIAALSDKVDSIHAGRSLGDAETRLLRSIRRSLDDLLYHMNISQVEPEAPAPSPVPDDTPPPVFGRRATPPTQHRREPGEIATPHVEEAFARSMPERRRHWPGAALIRTYPLASVAAAATLAIMLAQGMTQFSPRVGDITGSIRQAAAPVPQRPAAAPVAMEAATTPAVPPPGPAAKEAATPAATPPVLSYAPPPAASGLVVPQAPQQTASASRPAEDVAGLSAYQAGVRLADGPARDYRGAIQMFEKAGDVPAAQFRLALLYERGQGAPKNPVLARTLYQRAAEKGHVRAMHNLGVLYADGIDGKPDYANAAEWFRRAAEYGLRDSAFNLATLTARGLGVEKKPAAAYMWFAIAAAQGDAEAARQRDEIAKTLDAATLKSAKAAVDSFKPKQPDPAINQSAGNS